MEMNFSGGLQKMYRDILLQQHTLAYSSMIAAFAAAAENEELLKNSTSTANLLQADIPREDIECDVEFVVVRTLRENLKKMETNLNGMRGKKFGFREVIEMVNTRQPYPLSPGPSFLKRSRTTSFGSSSLPSSPLASNDDENQAKKPKTANDTVSTLDESNASSHDGNLTIDCGDLSTPAAPEKQQETPEDPASDGYKPSKLRFERMRNIQKTKPKFNIENLDLTYHSNMARNFPGSENRTGEQQARRDKNTLAARISRTKNRAIESIMEEQSKEATCKNIDLKRKIACLRVYANELMKANDLPDTNFNQMWEANIRDFLCTDK